ncbi:putative N,O-diacetyl muramidase [Sodiomyces alkalinus F11]|uniref:N,O-diacetylmuramidase n=1 Tax=Sodiomyces alkalinus (strain CBS 110278 / VKM F-3762 / F11) TaxID=1314773 RepID=A0A3N2Q713_SODAK|nr:putative N,O-diacetyl muramidase [Sodiomyces alkalinus F11]ROT42554.1 putative N,O-diacetyl muramidase [Sodiomyces alkalinus F11]
MKLLTSLMGLASLASLAAAQIHGFDISGWQPTTDFARAYANGDRFVYIKATEGTTFRSSAFSRQYTGATQNGFIRGAYHFAHPHVSTGAAQATFFAQNGGGWSRDGITLPGVLDIEYNPNGATCYGLSHAAMINWIEDFVATYQRLTSRWPVIYTTTDWWTQCTGNSNRFANRCPLWVARYASSVGTLPNGWGFYTFWQYNDRYPQGGDSNWFNGDASRLRALALG